MPREPMECDGHTPGPSRVVRDYKTLWCEAMDAARRQGRDDAQAEDDAKAALSAAVDAEQYEAELGRG